MVELRTPDGGFSNESELRWGMGPSTAAAVAVLSQLELPVPDDVAPWLLSQIHPKGGFKAIPDAPMPDLLSTATILHALGILGADIGGAKELCLATSTPSGTARASTATGPRRSWTWSTPSTRWLALGHLS